MQLVGTNLSASARVLPKIFGSASVASLGTATVKVGLDAFLAALPLLQNEVAAGVLKVVFTDNTDTVRVLGPLENAIRSLVVGLEENRVGYPLIDAAASTATSNKIMVIAGDRGIFVKEIRIGTAAAVTEDASNYATITVSKKSTGFGSSVTLATRNTLAGSGGTIAQGTTTIAFSGGVTEANRTLAEGEVLALDVAKTGTGVQLTAFLDISYRIAPTLQSGGL